MNKNIKNFLITICVMIVSIILFYILTLTIAGESIITIFNTLDRISKTVLVLIFILGGYIIQKIITIYNK